MSVVAAFAVAASRVPRGTAIAWASAATLVTTAMTTTTIRTTGTTAGGAGCGGVTD